MYDRWGLTNETAATIAGLDEAPTDAELDAAEEEIIDALGWAPDPARFPDTAAGRQDLRARAMGRAIAWQVRWRRDNPADAGDAAGDTGKTSESIAGDYSFSRNTGAPPPAGIRIADRARQLLVRAGLVAEGNLARSGSHREEPPDTWTQI
jgi:hypothetical protein